MVRVRGWHGAVSPRSPPSPKRAQPKRQPDGGQAARTGSAADHSTVWLKVKYEPESKGKRLPLPISRELLLLAKGPCKDSLNVHAGLTLLQGASCVGLEKVSGSVYARRAS